MGESILWTPDVIGQSNGHTWMRYRKLVCCRDCGIIRRADDLNKPCKGVANVGIRAATDGGDDAA
jgi:hypothetical protein